MVEVTPRRLSYAFTPAYADLHPEILVPGTILESFGRKYKVIGRSRDGEHMEVEEVISAYTKKCPNSNCGALLTEDADDCPLCLTKLSQDSNAKKKRCTTCFDTLTINDPEGGFLNCPDCDGPDSIDKSRRGWLNAEERAAKLAIKVDVLSDGLKGLISEIEEVQAITPSWAARNGVLERLRAMAQSALDDEDWS